MEEEATRWGGGSSGGAIAGGEDVRDCMWRDVGSADVEHGSYQVSDHVVEEAAASIAVDEKIAVVSLELFPC